MNEPSENPQPIRESLQDLKPDDKPLRELLPDLEEIPYDTLKEKFRELAVRCFNSENKLDLALELIKSYEKTIKELRKSTATETIQP